jgi:Acetyltransferase (GNAT) domain
LVVRAGDEPKALLVGRRERMRAEVKVGYFRIAMPELRTLIISHGGWLGELDEARAILFVDALKRLLASGEVDAVLLHFPEFASPLAQQALARPAFACRDHLLVRETHRTIDLPADGASYLRSLSSNERSQQRKRTRKFAEDLIDVRIESFRAPEDIAQLMAYAEKVAEKSYQRGIGVGFAVNDDVRSRLEFFARASWLRGFILFLNNNPCAFWIGSLSNGVFTGDYLAFDPSFGQYAPGMYMILEVIEKLAGDGATPARQIDLGVGDAVYKDRLSNRAVDEAQIFIFAPNLRGLSANLLRSSLGRVNRMLKYISRNSPLLAKAKRNWRRRHGAGK